MWASSALMIIVMGWDDKPHAPVYAMFFHRQKYTGRSRRTSIKEKNNGYNFFS